MRKALVIREPSTPQGTFSKVYLLDETGEKTPTHQWDGIELPDKGNEPNVSCVSAGTYIARPFDSPHFHRKVYRFEWIPNREAVEMHPANFAGDESAGWHSDLRGCIAIGKGRGMLYCDEIRKSQEAITGSRNSMDEFMAATDGEDVEFTFMWGVQEA